VVILGVKLRIKIIGSLEHRYLFVEES